MLWRMNEKGGFLKNTGRVLAGRRSWVGYISGEETDLPVIRGGVLDPGMLFPPGSLTPGRIRQLNILYAKDYRVWNDLDIVIRNWRNLGNNHHDS